MNVTSLYTNIPQEEGIHTVCRAYETFYINKPPIPTQLLEQALRLILQENSFQFYGKNYLQTHGTAMGTKVETEILSQSELKPLVLKRFIAFYRRHILALNYKQRQNRTSEQSSFTAEISDKETTFLDTYIYKGARFERNAIRSLICGLILNQLRHFNIHILNPAPQGNKKGFIKGEALRLLRTNSSKIMFEEKITNFKSQRRYPEDLVNTTLSGVNFKDRKLVLQQKQREIYDSCLLSHNTNHQCLT